MRQRNQNINLNPNVAMVPPGFEAILRDQRRVGIANNVLDETEARTMALPRMGLDIKKIVNEIFKGVQPIPSDSMTQMQIQNVECDYQSNVVGDQMEEKTLSLPNVISSFEKQVTNEAIQRVQDVRPMDTTEELRRPDDVCDHQSSANVVDEKEGRSMNLPVVISDFEKQVTDEAVQSVQDVRPVNEPLELWRPNDEAAGTERVWKVYTRKERPSDEAETKRILKVYTRKKRPNVEAGRILKVYHRKKRPNDEARTKRILKVYTRKKWHGGPRVNQQGNEEKDTTVVDKTDEVSKQ